MDNIKRISLDDVGTRGEHIMYLRDNWQLAVESLERRKNYLGVAEQKLLTNLISALNFVTDHLAKDFIDIENTITKEK
jgi:hypothetical protein